MIGKIVSHYKIIERIGGGGMGVVYKAEDTKLKRIVALKFLPPAFATDPTTKERFIHEAQSASALQHSNICTIHEIGETEDGQMYIVMDYYEGETLKLKIEKGKLKIDESMDIAIQIAQGLYEAHQKGIVHRDIKPANIIVTDKGEIKILDFGLAKFKGQTKITKTGSTLGTVAYMSPEQARGEEVDYRTDIWSLGVMLYEMLTGELPFKGDYDQALVYSILNEKPEPLHDDTPIELATIIEKCLEKNPAERYQNVDEFIFDLDVLRGESASQQTGRIGHKKRKKSFLIPTSALLVIIILLLVYLYIPFDVSEKTEGNETKWENSIGVLPFDNISNDPEQEFFCEGMTEQIISNLSRLPKLKVIARQSMMKYKDTEKTISEIGEELDVAYVLESSIRKFGDRIRVTAQLISTKDDFHVWSEDYDKEYKDLFEVQDNVSEAIARNLLKAISEETIGRLKENRPKNLEAWEYCSRGSHIHAKFHRNHRRIDYFNKSEELLKKAIELDPEYAPSYTELADLYNTYKNTVASTDEDKQKYINLQEKYINAGFKLDPNSADLHWVKAGFLWDKNDLYGAYDSFKKSIMIEPNNYRAVKYLGIFYQQRGLHDRAIKYLTRAIEINPISSHAYFAQSWCYIMKGDLINAELDIVKALDIESEYYYALWWYAWILIQTNRIAEAEEVIYKRDELSPDDSTTIILKSMVSYSLTGDKQKSLEMFPKGNLHIYLTLKMTEESVHELNSWFENVEKSERPKYLWLKDSHIFDFLRSDPRFQKIVEEHKKIYEENLEKYPDIDI